MDKFLNFLDKLTDKLGLPGLIILIVILTTIASYSKPFLISHGVPKLLVNWLIPF